MFYLYPPGAFFVPNPCPIPSRFICNPRPLTNSKGPDTSSSLHHNRDVIPSFLLLLLTRNFTFTLVQHNSTVVVLQAQILFALRCSRGMCVSVLRNQSQKRGRQRQCIQLCLWWCTQNSQPVSPASQLSIFGPFCLLGRRRREQFQARSSDSIPGGVVLQEVGCN